MIFHGKNTNPYESCIIYLFMAKFWKILIWRERKGVKFLLAKFFPPPELLHRKEDLPLLKIKVYLLRRLSSYTDSLKLFQKIIIFFKKLAKLIQR